MLSCLVNFQSETSLISPPNIHSLSFWILSGTANSTQNWSVNTYSIFLLWCNSTDRWDTVWPLLSHSSMEQALITVSELSSWPQYAFHTVTLWLQRSSEMWGGLEWPREEERPDAGRNVFWHRISWKQHRECSEFTEFNLIAFTDPFKYMTIGAGLQFK